MSSFKVPPYWVNVPTQGQSVTQTADERLFLLTAPGTDLSQESNRAALVGGQHTTNWPTEHPQFMTYTINTPQSLKLKQLLVSELYCGCNVVSGGHSTVRGAKLGVVQYTPSESDGHSGSQDAYD